MTRAPFTPSSFTFTFALALGLPLLLATEPRAAPKGTKATAAATEAASAGPQLVVETGHAKALDDVLFLSNDLVATGADDQTVRVWHAGTGRELRIFDGFGSTISLAASSDGKLLAAGSWGPLLRVWDLESDGPPLVLSKADSASLRSLAFHPSSVTLVTCHRSFVDVWNARTGAKLKRIEGLDASDAAFSPDGQLLAVAVKDALVLLRVSDWSELHRLPLQGDKAKLSFHPSGKRLVHTNAFGGDDVATIVDIDTFAVQKTITCGYECLAAFSPDGSLLAIDSGDKGIVKLFDATGDRVVREIAATGSWVTGFSFDPSGARIAVSYLFRPAATVYDVGTAMKIVTLEGHSQYVNQLAFSADGTRIHATTGYESVAPFDFALKTFGPDVQRELPTLKLPEHSSDIAVSPTGDLVATSTPVIISDARSGKELRRLPITNRVTRVEFSPDGNLLAVARRYVSDEPGAEFVELWDPRTGQRVRGCTGFRESVTSLDFSPDGKLLVAAGYVSVPNTRDDHTRDVRVYDVATGAEVKHIHSDRVDLTVNAMFSSSGKELVAELDGDVVVVSLATNKVLRTLKKRRVFALSADREQAYVWDYTGKRFFVVAVRNFATIATFTGNERIMAAAFSPDGKRIALGDGIVTHVHALPSGKRELTLIALDRTGWVAATPDGRFDGSPESFPRLSWRDGSKSVALDAFFEQLYTPGLVAQVMSGQAAAAPISAAPAVDLSKGFQKPPLVTLTAPPGPRTRTIEQLDLTVRAKDQGGGIGEIRLYQNGKLLSQDTRGFNRAGAASGADVTQTFPVALVPGTNRFRATALNTDRTESDPAEIELVLDAVTAGSDLYLVVIGIDAYTNGKYRLNYARTDATSFRDAVARRAKSIFGRIHEQLLLDDAATREGITAALAKVKAQARPQDSFIFYYAGHGVMSEGAPTVRSQFFLIPPDVTRLYGDDALLESRAVSVELLKQWATDVKAQKQLIVLDACQSGGAVDNFAMRGAAEEKAILQLARSAGIVVLAATGTEQFASELKDLGHGVFTYALLQGMNGAADAGADGKVTVKELDAYLNDKVPELTRKFRGTAQYPNSFARGQDFPIAVTGGP